MAKRPDARNLFTNLEINNKNEVSYRCKRPLQGIIFGGSKHQIHFWCPRLDSNQYIRKDTST